MPQLIILGGPVIGIGQTVSGVLDIGTSYICGLVMPVEWTPAVVTVIVSPDGDNFYDLRDFGGGAIAFNVMPGAIVNIDPHRLLLARYLQFRSGTADDPVAQTKARTFRTIGTMQLAFAAAAAENPARP